LREGEKESFKTFKYGFASAPRFRNIIHFLKTKREKNKN